MSMRKKTLVGLLILIFTILAGMFAARAVRGLSSAEVRAVSPGRGRLEDTLISSPADRDSVLVLQEP